MTQKLFTIGYEGYDIDSFIAYLKSFGIECLLDVREIPLSRKKGFSKSALAARLNLDNIEYLHFKELGSPKAIRKKLKQDDDYPSFFETMKKHLAMNKEAVGRAYGYVSRRMCCLMCFEQLAEKCHRRVVADEVKNWNGNGLKIVNL